jgi:PAS domain S-box-containing protein
MKNINTTWTKTSTLHQRAEALLKEQHEKANLTAAEADMLKLIHELKDNQIELELQNEKLKFCKTGARESIVDITGQKLAENILHDIKFKYDELVRHISVGLYKMRVFPDGKMKFEYVSDKLCKMLGLEEQVALNNPETVFSAIHPEDYPAMVEANRIAAKNPELFHWEGRCRIWGKMGWIRIESEPTILSDGGSLWNGVIFDITRQKKDELTLQQSEARFRSYFELPLIGIAITSPEKGWIEANDGLKAMLGYSMVELSGLTWEDLTHPDDLAYDVEQFNRVMANQQDTYFLEKRFIHKNGNIIWTNLSVGCVRKPDRSVDYTVALLQNITDRKHSEDELRINEERYRLLAENSRDVIWTMKLDGTITYISPAVEQLRGFTVEESMRQPLDKILTPDSQAIVIEYLQRLNTAFESGMPLESFRGENEYYCKDGSTLWTEVIVYPLPPNDNGSVTLLGVTRDNNERRKAENALRKSEEMLRETGRMAKLGGWELDLFTMELTWTEETYRIHEVEPHQKPLLEDGINFYTPESRPVLQKALDLAITQGVPFDVELQFITAKGNHLWVRSFGKADLVDGHPVRLFGVFQDITERQKAEEELNNEVIRRRILMEQSKDGIVILDQNGKVFESNKKFAEMLGYPVDSMSSLHVFDWEFLYPQEQVIKMIRRIDERGDHFESKHRRKDGSVYDVEISSNATWFKEQKLIFCICRDITERNQAKQELVAAKEKAEESDRLKSAFLANMSHEIRTPMNGILGFADLLKEPGLTGDEQLNYIEIIEKSGKRMLNIINDIIDISKIEAGLMKLDISESNINEQIEYIYTFFKPEVEAKGMKLSFRNYLTAKEAIIKTDREKLYAILTNLVKNAIKYSKEGEIEIGYKRVATQSIASLLQFYVKDTGIGIPKNRQEAIFERFIQADIADKMARQGAGLGLTITKSYIEMLGGKIWVESEEGIGSTFYFTLPYNAQPAKEITDQQPESLGNDYDFGKLKILIAEDDIISEMLIDSYIKMFGNEVLKAKTGSEAVEIYRDNPDIDLILMDIRMPDMDGYEATRQIRQFNQEVVIIAQTAYGLFGDKEKAIEAGCSDYIAKPINKIELQRLIKKCERRTNI